MPIKSVPVWPSKAELIRRSKAVQSLMRQEDMDGALFFQDADLLYLCGTTQAEAVFLPLRGRPLVLAGSIIDRVRTETRLADVEPMPPRSKLRPCLEAYGRRKLRVLGLELDVLPVNFFQGLGREVLAWLEPGDVSPLILRARSVKSEFEVRQLKAAAGELDQVFQTVPDVLAQGVTELGLEARLFGMAHAMGHQGLYRSRGFNHGMFLGHILSGTSGLIRSKMASPTGGSGVSPGYGQGAGLKAIGPGELVSVDILGNHGGYIVDQARLFFTGPVPDAVRETYERLLNVVKSLIKNIRPGMTSGAVYEQSFKLAEKNGLSDGYMGLGRKRCPFIGHGVGLEFDELPILSRKGETILEAGMVFALEPRVFLPEIGVVGIEDTYYLAGDGPEPITFSDRDIKEVKTSGPDTD